MVREEFILGGNSKLKAEGPYLLYSAAQPLGKIEEEENGKTSGEMGKRGNVMSWFILFCDKTFTSVGVTDN
ncbi:hypothetical protein CDAR_205921 [Caerostris darwini]|uniref:Uncharacterized protein n=1 Tax=Caerostris darwini TaxID=1538125 RepID=A0AAV4WJS7_9ARAC|nr:hypothetical protein CDAR_205921 [Caerostris darwini]